MQRGPNKKDQKQLPKGLFQGLAETTFFVKGGCTVQCQEHEDLVTKEPKVESQLQLLQAADSRTNHLNLSALKMKLPYLDVVRME